MRQIVSRVHRGLAWVAMAGFVVQFYLVGATLFGSRLSSCTGGLATCWPSRWLSS